MADKIKELASAKIADNKVGQFIYDLKTFAESNRRLFERKWYDINFFDDGYHFRYMSRSQGKIVDLTEKSSIYSPLRALPKASKQARGIANLLTASKYTPVVYPQKLIAENFSDPEMYEQAKKLTREIAKKSGYWIENYFKEEEIIDKLTHMVLLSIKHGVSYLQIWPDAVEEKIRCQVYDAFDIYLMGDLNSMYDSPFIMKASPRLVSEIKADERFDKEQVEKITPDNKFASSDIKDAYAKSRYGAGGRNDTVTTVVQGETYLKEYINPEVKLRISQQENADEILSGKKDGDMVIRQVFTAGNIRLASKYLKLKDYPFVEYRLEPGPMYQTPLYERFMPANKSLDMAVSRLETFFHTMNVGVWMKRQGEQVNISNQAGGQIVEYSQTPPVQGNITSPSSMSFPFLGFLSSLIEEQGVTTSTLGKIPTGVRANSAIESLKESEYASLQIAQSRLQTTVKKIAEIFLDYADDYFVKPQTVYMLNQGQPDYFDVIGGNAYKRRKQLGVMDGIQPGTVPLKGDYKVDIQIEQGLAFTSEGRKKRAKEIMDSILPYVQQGFINPEAFRVLLQNWLETWQYGPVGDIMEALKTSELSQQLTDEKIAQVKIAVLEALKEAGEIGPKAQENRIMENKIGVIEALKDTGMLEKSGKKEDKGPAKSISFKDLPPSGKTQLAAQAGIELSEEEVEGDEEAELLMKAQEMQMKQREHQMKMENEQEKMRMKAVSTQQQMALKEQAARSSKNAKKSK